MFVKCSSILQASANENAEVSEILLFLLRTLKCDILILSKCNKTLKCGSMM